MEGEQGAGAGGADGSNEANNIMLQQQQQQQEETVRFEDLTVDDDLPILDRIVRYSQSQIALQRLVHVKMLGETAELSGYVVATVVRYDSSSFVRMTMLPVIARKKCDSLSLFLSSHTFFLNLYNI